ncbi:hypothetical protein LWI28_002832 [Acer negundo]|uniref:Transport inhibitor response 1 domain-containing protein n=1 Tax=Acer negundo TaxID=4023 RepID=A0AAD5ND70_ACENE|nr:hypothetical protein LWI28_002832 [Acer negundo]
MVILLSNSNFDISFFLRRRNRQQRKECMIEKCLAACSDLLDLYNYQKGISEFARVDSGAVIVVVPGRGARASFSSVDFTQGLELGVGGVQKLVPCRAVVEDSRVHRKLLLCLAGDSGASVSQNSLRNPKGKPRFSDFNLVPHNWGADFHTRLVVFANNYPFLEELRLK